MGLKGLALWGQSLRLLKHFHGGNPQRNNNDLIGGTEVVGLSFNDNRLDYSYTLAGRAPKGTAIAISDRNAPYPREAVACYLKLSDKNTGETAWGPAT